jgi:hypothetical protein
MINLRRKRRSSRKILLPEIKKFKELKNNSRQRKSNSRKSYKTQETPF